MHVVSNSERALAERVAALDLVGVLVEVKRLLEGLDVAATAHMRAIEADELSDVAAKTALVVYELLTVAGPTAVNLTNTDLF